MTDWNRKRILQELIENLLKEEKDDKHAYSLKLHNSEGYEKVIPLKKKTVTELPLSKFKYYSLQTSVGETLEFKDTIEFSSDKKKLI